LWGILRQAGRLRDGLHNGFAIETGDDQFRPVSLRVEFLRQRVVNQFGDIARVGVRADLVILNQFLAVRPLDGQVDLVLGLIVRAGQRGKVDLDGPIVRIRSD
jgi:hypothetical protein